MEQVSIEEAAAKDIPEIRRLAVLVWNQHYPSVIGRRQVDYMLDLMYSEKSLAAQMQEKKHRFFLVRNGGEIIGFISCHLENKNELFINKFYINQQMAGKGIGSAVFRLILMKYSPDTVRLTVNRQNVKAINFYFRNGFTIERVADFEIGNGFVMNDFVMVWRPKTPGNEQIHFNTPRH